MASEAKKKKAKNSYIYNGGMKSKSYNGKIFKGVKGLDFYTASDRYRKNKNDY